MAEQVFSSHLQGKGLAELRGMRLPAYSSYSALQASGNRFGVFGKYFAYIDETGAWQKVLLESDINTAVDLGGSASSDSVLSSQKAVKSYVDGVQNALNTAITNAVSNAQNALTAQMNALRSITAWNPANPFPTTRSVDSLPFKEGDFVQVTANVGGYKAGDILVATVNGATTVAQFADKNESTEIATSTIYGTVRLIEDLATFNQALPANDSKVITQAVLKGKLDAMLASITQAFSEADATLQTAINALSTSVSSIQTALTSLTGRVDQVEIALTTQASQIAQLIASALKKFTQTVSTSAGVVQTITHGMGRPADVLVAKDTTDNSSVHLDWVVNASDPNNKVDVVTLGSMTSVRVTVIG